MEILIDTNFFMIPGKYKIDIFEQLKNISNKIFTLDACIRELEKISKGNGKDALYAKIGLELVKKNNINVFNTDKEGDTAIKDYAYNNKCGVATNDKILIKDLKNNNIKIIRLRQKKYIIEDR